MRYWAEKIGGFEYLNVTGKDIYIKTESIRTPAQNSLYDGFETVRTAGVKPFLVTDEMGRHVDIRGWDMPKPTVTLTWNWGGSRNGAKKHIHRMNGPSMRHRTLQNMCEDRVSEQDNGAVIDVPGVRKKTLIGPGEEESFYCKGDRSKSWKDQSKSSRQYTKHKSQHPRNKPQEANCEEIWQNLIESGFCVSSATACG